jgi:subtilisin family serine protease
MKFLLFALAANAARFLSIDEPIENQYIVVFKKHLAKNLLDSHKEIAMMKNIQIDRHYSIGELFNGYAARMPQDSVNYLLDQPEVDYVQQDGLAHASDYFKDEPVPTKRDSNVCATQLGATWGLVRTSQVNLDINGKYSYEADGGGAYAFVLDTGIYIGHDDFNGRALWGANFVDKDDFDGNGHGTHCAGTIGGTQYGLAKKCRLVAVKVLSASGSGAWSGVIDGINYVANDARRPATINLSLGGGLNLAVNDAVDAASLHGLVTVVAAAGNNNGDTCASSPASASTAIAVGATDNADNRASFSNHGECMSLFAPGADVTSTWIGAPDAVNTISGTSMASPHVCGVATKYLGERPKDAPSVVKAWILDQASGNLVKNVPLKTVNLLLFNGCSQSTNATVKLSKRYL